ncbi:Glycoside hydrolase [Trema orientale]|uniref:Glycoside hydrolase n=1 Tax=Trema orientale TaxID=63057 RepID=A0A2P5EAX5_TREOI|nr:Glycoside hydrolase [Trema orientale]
MRYLCSIALLLLLKITYTAAVQCGRGAGGALCPNGYCCSIYGRCGNTWDYCQPGKCQSQCHTPSPPPPHDAPVADIISSDLFEEMLSHRNDPLCERQQFYTYDAFIAAANRFPSFGTTGDLSTRKREVAAFLAQTSHETTAKIGPVFQANNIMGGDPSKSVSNNYNYGPAGEALGVDLLSEPDLVATNATLSFETALWFWMTLQNQKPSCHDIITGAWRPTAADVAAGRLPGYGLTTNVINGELECGHGFDERMKDRVGFYKRSCKLLGVSPGKNVDCAHQRPFSFGVTNPISDGPLKMSVDQ